MLVTEMIYRTKMKDDRLSSYIVSAFKDEDVLRVLNEAQNNYINKVTESMKGPGFHGSKSRIRDIRHWYKSDTVPLATSTDMYHSKTGDTPSDASVLLYGSCSYTFKGLLQRATCNIISPEDRHRYTTTSDHIPSFRNPVILEVTSGTLQIITDYERVLTDSFTLYYTRRPDVLVTGTPGEGEVNDLNVEGFVAENIINLAVEDIRKTRETASFQMTKDTNNERI